MRRLSAEPCGGISGVISVDAACIWARAWLAPHLPVHICTCVYYMRCVCYTCELLCAVLYSPVSLCSLLHRWFPLDFGKVNSSYAWDHEEHVAVSLPAGIMHICCREWPQLHGSPAYLGHAGTTTSLLTVWSIRLTSGMGVSCGQLQDHHHCLPLAMGLFSARLIMH